MYRNVCRTANKNYRDSCPGLEVFGKHFKASQIISSDIMFNIFYANGIVLNTINSKVFSDEARFTNK